MPIDSGLNNARVQAQKAIEKANEKIQNGSLVEADSMREILGYLAGGIVQLADYLEQTARDNAD